jgi:hypothetical protein
MLAFSRRINLVVLFISGIVAAIASQILVTTPNVPATWLIIPLVALFVLFWPVAAFSLRGLRLGSARILVGPAAFAGTVLAVMVSAFGKPYAAGPVLSTAVATPQLLAPAFCGGVLLAWLALEAMRSRSLKPVLVQAAPQATQDPRASEAPPARIAA